MRVLDQAIKQRIAGARVEIERALARAEELAARLDEDEFDEPSHSAAKHHLEAALSLLNSLRPAHALSDAAAELEGQRETPSAGAATPHGLPKCLRCDKPVDTLRTEPSPRDKSRVVVIYECHGESVSQELPSSALEGGQGLSSYTAFNAYTSGLMPGGGRTE